LLDSLLQEILLYELTRMFAPTTSPWPTYSNTSLMYDVRSTSTVDSWESSGSSQGGSSPPPYLTSAWPGPVTRQQLVTSSHGSVWDKSKDYYEDVFGRGFDDAANVLDGDSSFAYGAGFGTTLQEKDKPDLLDSLVMEDQMEKARYRELKQFGACNYQASSMEVTNLLKLLQLQQPTNIVAVPEGRAITRDQKAMSNMNQNHRMLLSCNPSFGSNMSINAPLKARSMKQSVATSNLYASSVLPSKMKAPPPHHPPAVALVTDNFKQLTTSPVTPQPGSAAALKLRVQEATWQFQGLEVDRKKTEAALAKQNPGKRISSSNTVQIPRLPLNPSKLDKLLVDSLREHARVLTLLQRVEIIYGNTRTQDSFNHLAMWKEKILIVMSIRRKERMNQEEKSELVEEALAKMSLASRKTRTVLWTIMMKKGNA